MLDKDKGAEKIKITIENSELFERRIELPTDLRYIGDSFEMVGIQTFLNS